MTLGHRPQLLALLARAIAVGVALVVSGLLTSSAATALAPGDVAEPDDVFSARIERVERDPGPVGRPVRYTYTVQVQQVFGASEVRSVRVRVQTTPSFNECATRPEIKGNGLYLWTLQRQSGQLVADGCRDVLRATELRLTEAAQTYGDPRSPIDTEPVEPPVEFPDVTYTCPGTSQAITVVVAAEQACDEVAAPTSFDRAAAPGLALVIVGVLGWIAVLRLGRTRRS